MTRLVPALAAVVMLIVGCGSGGSVEDPAGAGDPTSPSPAPTPTPSEPAPSMIGDHPAYPVADYTYDLEVQCYCPYFGQPVRVTVVGGEVESAVWVKRAPDHAAGDEVTDEWLRLSINDVLEDAADPEWDKVTVEWPAGQDHPDQVAIDRIEDAVDDEVTYVLGNVQPAA